MSKKRKGGFETKSSPAKQGLSYRGATFGMGDKLDTNLDVYYNLYRWNTDLRRAVEELYQTAGKDGYKLYKGEGENEKEIENSPIKEILEFGDGFLTLKSKIIRDLQIAGNVFILNILNASSQIIGFQVLDPRTIRIVANEYGEVIKYLQVVRGKTLPFDPEEILHFKDMIDPDNEVMGISKIETLCYDIMADKEAGRSNYSFFKNNTIPNTIIYLDNELSQEEQQIALEQLKNQFSGGENRHKVSASSGIKDVKIIAQSFKDMEFIALRNFTTERICVAMGVPKTVIGYSDNVNYSTSDNQYRTFIENTILPLENQLEHIFITLISQIESGINLEFINQHNFDLKDKVERNEKLVLSGIKTINEARKDLGLTENENEYANELIIKQGNELLQDIGMNNINTP